MKRSLTRGKPKGAAFERWLRLLVETSVRSKSFFLRQFIEEGIAELAEVWVPPNLLAQVRAGRRPDSGASGAVSNWLG